MSGDEGPGRRRDELALADVVDVALGAGVAAAGLATTLARPFLAAAGTVVALGARGPLGGPGRRLLADLADRGGQVRAALERLVVAEFRRRLPVAVETVLAVVDLNQIVRRHVDLDLLAEGIDVDAVVARADVDAVVARADLDAAVARVDMDAIIARLDLDGIVAKVDLDAIAARLDLDELAEGIDVDAVVARVDIDATLARLDLAGIARHVIDAIDLPEILRQSTGAVSSETVRGVRAQSMSADDAVAGVVDRILRRRQRPALP